MSIYFYADPHFCHENIIKFCGRPFKNKEQMNDHLIKEYNSIVRDEDLVYFLGDISVAKSKEDRERVADIISKLNGNKILIRGNHDRLSPNKYYDMGFIAVLCDATLRVGTRFVKLTHLPDYDAVWNFCGHVHEHWKTSTRCFNCGVDVWDFKPVNIGKLVQLMDKYEQELFNSTYLKGGI